MKELDIVGFGNSVLDITVEVDENFLIQNNIKKSEFLLIDDKKSIELKNLLKNTKQNFSPGGSVSNIIAGISLLGGKVGYIGGIGTDDFGEEYKKRTIDLGVNDYFIKKDSQTGQCFTFITQDKERSFAVNLGKSNFISEEEINLDFKSKFILIEGYKLESDIDFKTAEKLCEHGKKTNTKVALDVNDAGVIKRMDKKLVNFIKKNVDILFMNELEAKALTGFENEAAIDFVKKEMDCKIIVLKLGENGSNVYANEKYYKINIEKSNNLINTNGAGDAYAAAFLFGLIKNKSFEDIGLLASSFSKLVVEQEEARLVTLPDSIKKLLI